MNDIETVEQAEKLDAGQWVEDADGEMWCMFQTHIMVHQWMWKAGNSGTYVALDQIKYPVKVMDLDERDGYVCPHKRVQECGQCKRCGSVVGDTEKWRQMVFGAIGVAITDIDHQPHGTETGDKS